MTTHVGVPGAERGRPYDPAMPLSGTSPGDPTATDRRAGRRAARRARRCGAAVLVVTLLAAGCSDDEDEAVEQEGSGATTTSTTAEEPTSTTTTAPTSTTSTTAAPSSTTTTRPFEGSTARVELPLPASTQEVVSHTELTVTSGGGEERITFGFDGALPGAVVEYVDRPVREAGSGDEVAVPGDAVLAIRFEPASSAVLDGEDVTRTYTGPDRVAGAGTVLEVVRTGDFEAVYEWVAGLGSEVPFRVEADSAAATVTIVVPAG